MELTDRQKLKCYFETGAVPTEEQFAEFIDTVINQVDDDINVLRAESGVNVGIGTDAPRAKLEVAGNIIAENLLILKDDEPISVEDALDIRSAEEISINKRLNLLDPASGEFAGGSLKIRKSGDGGIKLIGKYDKYSEGSFISLENHISSFKDISQGAISIWFRYLPENPSKDHWFRLFTLGHRDDELREGDGVIIEVSNPEIMPLSVRVVITSGGQTKLKMTTSLSQEGNLAGWHHLLFTVGEHPDGSGFNQLYLNGSAVDPGDINYEAGNSIFHDVFLNVAATPNIFRLGSVLSGGNTLVFYGLIDEVAILNKSLSEGEVREIYNGALTHELEKQYQSTLVGYWKMGNDLNFPLIRDYSGNDHDAGINGPLTLAQIPSHMKYNLIYKDSYLNETVLNERGWKRSGNDLFTDGNVGIGTNVPVSKLHINDQEESIAKIETTGENYSARIHLASPAIDGYVGVYGSNYSNEGINKKLVLSCWNNPVALQTMNARLEFWTRGKERLTIENDGYIGIGQPMPKYELDVNGTVSAKEFMLQTGEGAGSPVDLTIWTRNSSGDIRSGSGNVGIGVNSPAEKLVVNGAVSIGSSKTNNPGTIRWSGSDFEGRIRDKWVSLTRGASKGYNFVDGLVGIGTDKPRALLHVVGPQMDIKGPGATSRGHILVGRPSGYNLVIDDNEIAVRRNKRPANLHLQAYGGDITIHKDKGIESEVVFKDKGRLGLGTRAPRAKLHIAGTSDLKRGGNGLLILGDPSDYHMAFDDNEIAVRKGRNPWHMHLQAYGGDITIHKDRPDYLQVVITDNGKVGIGNNDPLYRLDVNGEARKSTSNHSWIIKSDKRIKKNIKDFKEGLDALMKIRPVRFQYNGKWGTKSGEPGIGLIAQEVQQTFPYMVNKVEERLEASDGKKTPLLEFNPSSMLYVLINTVKELNQKIKDLESRI